MNPTKLGRCECRGIECHLWSQDKDDKGSHVAATRCQADAVRMVTVHVGERKLTVRPEAVPEKEWERGIFKRIALCAACADFHEKGGAK